MNKERFLTQVGEIGKTKERFDINKLTTMDYTLKGNKKVYKESLEAGMFNMAKLHILHEQLVEDDSESDWYSISGDMINHFMLTHPKLKFAWEDMCADERWNFVEAIHYGIESHHRSEIYDQHRK